MSHSQFHSTSAYTYKSASSYFLLLNEMDPIVDFLQMIFKTSNTSYFQDNNQRQHQKIQKHRAREKVRGGGIFPNTWYWRHTESQFPTSPFFFITATMGVEQSIHVRQGGVNSLFERALLDALREAAEESQIPSEQFEHAWDPEDCSPKFRVLRDRLTARRLPSPLTTDAIRGMFTIQEIPLPQKQFRTKR